MKDISDLLEEFRGNMTDTFADFMHESNYRVIPEEDCVKIRYNLAGTKKSDISIQLKGDMLHLTAKNESGKFVDKHWISPSVDVEKISSKYEDGVLTIILPYVKDIDIEVF